MDDAWIEGYLRATRGSQYSRQQMDAAWIRRFFADCLETFSDAGIGTSSIKLVVVDSVRAQLETVKDNIGSYVIYDQSMAYWLDTLNKLLFGLEPEANARAWAHRLSANRYFVNGRRDEALAELVFFSGLGNAEPRKIDGEQIYRLARWRSVQEAFIVTHELLHCQDSESGMVLAEGMAYWYLELVRPVAQRIDLNATSVSQPLTKLEDHLRKVLEALSPMASGRAERIVRQALSQPLEYESVEARIDAALGDLSGLREEVLCDATALAFTVEAMGNDVLPTFKCYMACQIGILHLLTIRGLEIFNDAVVRGDDYDDALALVLDMYYRQFLLAHCAAALHERDTRHQEASEDKVTFEGDHLRATLAGTFADHFRYVFWPIMAACADDSAMVDAAKDSELYCSLRRHGDSAEVENLLMKFCDLRLKASGKAAEMMDGGGVAELDNLARPTADNP